MGKSIIEVKDLSKLYRIGQIGATTLQDSFERWWYRMLGKEDKLKKVGEKHRMISPDDPQAGPEPNTIWALRDISFSVQQGEIVGIIGKNGSGKSTLLKILSRITEPTSGEAILRGRTSSLLEVGTGFHRELTGRENIYLSGTILGMRKKEIDKKFDEIVAFAEIEKFIDTPVKRYSSGMYVRLAFAVAAHLEPDILLVDEVLAVGDAAFQKKCLGKMGEVAKEGRTVLFVSHNMGAVNRLCQRAMWLDEGRLCIDGPAEQVVPRYLTSGSNIYGERVWTEGIAQPGVEEFRLKAVRIKNGNGDVTGRLDVRMPFWVEIEYEIFRRLPFCRVGIIIATVDGIAVLETYDADKEDYAGPREPGIFISKCKIPGNLLSPRRFLISINAGMRGVKNLVRLENVLSFDIEDTGAVGSHVGGRRIGVIRPSLEWQREVL